MSETLTPAVPSPIIHSPAGTQGLGSRRLFEIRKKKTEPMKNFKTPHIQSQPIHVAFSLKGLANHSVGFHQLMSSFLPRHLSPEKKTSTEGPGVSPLGLLRYDYMSERNERRLGLSGNRETT